MSDLLKQCDGSDFAKWSGGTNQATPGDEHSLTGRKRVDYGADDEHNGSDSECYLAAPVVVYDGADVWSDNGRQEKTGGDETKTAAVWVIEVLLPLRKGLETI